MPLPINYSFTSESPVRSRHFAVTHNWEISILNKWIGNRDPKLRELSDAMNALGKEPANQGVNVITASCTQVSVPNSNVSTVEGNIKGVRFHQIQTRSSSPIQTSLVFYEVFDYRLYRFFELWKSLTVSRWDGSQNPFARIKNGVSLTLYTTDRTRPILTYILYETFCASAQISDPQGSGALQNLSVTLQSSNYGLIVPGDGEDPYGDPVYKIIDPKYLGTADEWITANGNVVNRASYNSENK